MARDFRGLRYELDIPRKIRRSFREQTVLWIGAAAVVGTLIVLLPLRRKKIYVDLASGAVAKPTKKLLDAGLLLGALRIALPLLKPAIENLVARKMGGFAGAPRSRKW